MIKAGLSVVGVIVLQFIRFLFDAWLCFTTLLLKIYYMKVLILSICLLIGFNCIAQDTTKVEQYCEVVATGKLFSNKVTIDIDYGEERSFWKDNRLKDEDGKLKKFNSVIDAINYLGKVGWKLVNAFPVTVGSSGPYVYHYVFKKDFLKSETETN